MKNYFKILHLLIVLHCITSVSNAQNNFNLSSKNSISKKESLPQNRTAFIFSNSIIKTAYSNPAYAMLNTKNQKSGFKNNQSASSVSVNQDNTNISQDDICMYPNTTDDELWIQLKNIPAEEGNLNIEIYNSSGQRVFITRLISKLHKINVCDLSAGTFLIKLGDTVQKMVIE